MDEKNIVFYDGDCGFCNTIVGYILEYEKSNEIYFATLQSKLAQRELEGVLNLKIDYSTFYYLENGRIYSKSKGFFKLSRHLLPPISWLRFFSILPTFLTDFFYDLIAKQRRKIISPRCYLPTSEQRQRFLS